MSKKTGAAILATAVGLFKTSDGGVQWQQLINSDYTIGALISPINKSTYYVLKNDQRWYVSTDAGKSWAAVGERTLPQLTFKGKGRTAQKKALPVLWLAYANYKQPFLLALCYNEADKWLKIFKSKNDGKTWEESKLNFKNWLMDRRVSDGPNGAGWGDGPSSFYVSDDEIFVGTLKGMLYNSKDGINWGGNNVSKEAIVAIVKQEGGNGLLLRTFSGKIIRTDSAGNPVKFQQAELPSQNNLIDTEPLYSFQSVQRYHGAYGSTGIRQVAMSQDGKLIASTSRWSGDDGKEHDYMLSMFNVGSFDQVKQVKIDDLRPLIFSPDSRYLIAFDRVYESSTLNEIARLQTDEKCEIHAIDISPDNTYVAIGTGIGYGSLGYAYIYDANTWGKVTKIKYQSQYSDGRNDSRVLSITFSVDGKNVKIKTSDDTDHFYSVGDWVELSHPNIRSKHAYSPNFDLMARVDDNTSIVHISQTKTNREIQTFRFDNRDAVNWLFFSGDGRFLFMQINDNPWSMYEVGTWKQIQNIGGVYSGWFREFSNKWLISSTQREVKYGTFDLETLHALDASKISLSVFLDDVLKLGYVQQVEEVKKQAGEVDTDFQEKLTALTSEREKALAALGGTKKDEFETDAEFKDRMATRGDKIKQVMNNFTDSRLALRREHTNKRLSLISKYEEDINKLLVETKKPLHSVNVLLGAYIAETEMFPVSITENNVTFFTATARVPKAEARDLRVNLDKSTLTGNVQLNKTGIFDLSNAVLQDRVSGKSYPLVNALFVGQSFTK